MVAAPAPPQVALATAAAVGDDDIDHPLLAGGLDRLGITWSRPRWDDPDVDWGSHELVVVRSTWDYPRHRDRFCAWADDVASVTSLCNPAPVLRWNTDKRYLRELAEADVPVVPTRWLAPGDDIELPGAGDMVVKPVVSAGAWDTARYREGQQAEAEAHAERLLAAGRHVMAQPYVASVDARGERGLVHVDGRMAHAFRKGPLLSTARAPSKALYLGEDISQAVPDDDELALADDALDALPWPRSSLLYARVDVVRLDDGSPALMELELVEPSLWYRAGPRTADVMAEAIAARL
jgi:glutathione synthase/RimK-type ligase-like ATP-grasp enzyme